MFEYKISHKDFSKRQFVILNRNVIGPRTYLILMLREDYMQPEKRIAGGLAVVQEVKIPDLDGGYRTAWNYRQFGDNYTDALDFFSQVTGE